MLTVEILPLLAALLLSVVLLSAGLGKLRRRWSFAATVRSWGVGDTAAVRLSLAIPAAELSLGLGLAAAVAARSLVSLMALAACSLLAVFVVGQVAIVGTGRRPACGCFGSSSRMGLLTIGRAVGLGVLAAAVALNGVGFGRWT
jgi:hypothetical protein